MVRLKSLRIASLVSLGLASLPGTALAQQAPSAAEEFPVGSSGSVCEAQGVSLRGARQSIFDRKWALLCRDADGPVGSAYKLRGNAAMPQDGALTCDAAASVQIEGAGAVSASDCRTASGLQWRSYAASSGKWRYVVQGLAGYDSALRLALRSLIADRALAGEVSVVSTGAGGTLGSAKAAATDPETIIGQGYRRNNAGAYAEAAELFEPVGGSPADSSQDDAAERLRRKHEMMVNRALQLSNLGEFDQAARLFGDAREMAANDPIQSRLSRNFEAIDALNHGDLDAVVAVLDRPVAPLAAALAAQGGEVRIDPVTAAGLNTGNSRQRAAILGQEIKLTIPERAAIIDAQAGQIRGTAQRLGGKQVAARATLVQANNAAVAVREGRVVSITRLRSQILSELAAVAEQEGDNSRAEALLRQAALLVETQYPDSASLNAVRARLAGFLVRRGRKGEAMALYKGIVENVAGNRGALVGMTNLIRPYFAMLAENAASDPAAAADLFAASQLVERPGAADTLAQLSRQLEAGDGKAANLFRQSLALSRDIERNRILIAQANALAASGGQAPQLAELARKQDRLVASQLQLLNTLAAYPQFRSATRTSIALDELRGALHPGEAYFKLTQLGGETYAILATQSAAKGWKVAASSGDIAVLVASLRDSISVTVNGVRSTYPFDIDADVKLSDALFGPVAGDLAGVRHIVFEPDGAMLQLPLNLLIADKAGVSAYRQRVDGGGDEYDMRGIVWLGRDRAVSTALSAASFRDARKAPASTARRVYLGLGQNLPLGPSAALPSVRGVSAASTEPGCDWPAAAWNNPISSAELKEAATGFGGAGSELLTQAAFTDTAVKNLPELADFRIVHFATHGLTGAPRDGCPARPALLTSFGGRDSDGLLRFDEIFNLRMDADLVILSACDTASAASLAVTREAGVRSGGGQALDGLVRAFIAAGGRQVIASHWPAPDDFGATKRLFTRFFGGRGETIGEALRQSQLALMDDAQTSHPFYWAGFAIVGDGARTVSGR